MPKALIYVHGTNGSGKSTLARYLIMCAGGISDVNPHHRTTAKVTYTRSKLACVGKYHTATGGADGVQPYALVPQTAVELIRDGFSVLVEGLMTPGMDTCQRMHDKAKKLGATVKFIRLDIGYFQAVEHVKRRRKMAGNDKPLDTTNLRKKQQTCDRWLENLAAQHLPVMGLNWEQARDVCLMAYGLSPEGATRVFD